MSQVDAIAVQWIAYLGYLVQQHRASPSSFLAYRIGEERIRLLGLAHTADLSPGKKRLCVKVAKGVLLHMTKLAPKKGH